MVGGFLAETDVSKFVPILSEVARNVTDQTHKRKEGRKRNRGELPARSQDESFGKECKRLKAEQKPVIFQSFAEPQASHEPPPGGWHKEALQKLVQIGYIHSDHMEKYMKICRKLRCTLDASDKQRKRLLHKHEKFCVKFTKAMHDFTIMTTLQRLSKLAEQNHNIALDIHEKLFPQHYAQVCQSAQNSVTYMRKQLQSNKANSNQTVPCTVHRQHDAMAPKPTNATQSAAQAAFDIVFVHLFSLLDKRIVIPVMKNGRCLGAACGLAKASLLKVKAELIQPRNGMGCPILQCILADQKLNLLRHDEELTDSKASECEILDALNKYGKNNELFNKAVV